MWAYLCAGRAPSHVTALWCANGAVRPSEWYSIVAHPSRAVTVVHAPLDIGLVALIGKLCDYVGTPAASPRRVHVRRRAEARWQSFDERYDEALSTASDSAVRHVVDQYRTDYVSLCDYLLAQRSDGVGPRWFPSITPGGVDIAQLALDTTRAIRRSIEVVDAFARHAPKNRLEGVIPISAAQASISAALEVAHLNGLDVETEWRGDAPAIRLPPGLRFVVGTDPFFEGRRSASWLRCICLDRDITYSFCTSDAPPTTGVDLLTEDEWEAVVVAQHASTQSRLHVGTETIDLPAVFLAHCPPPYSWGFIVSELGAFRRRYPDTTLTRRWHIVSSFNGTEQLCKGGALRDRLRRTFLLGSRGYLKAGEYDEFVQFAAQHAKENDRNREKA